MLTWQEVEKFVAGNINSWKREHLKTWMWIKEVKGSTLAVLH